MNSGKFFYTHIHWTHRCSNRTVFFFAVHRIYHNLSAAAMVWDKPMEAGQTEPEWQKRFEVIITHGESESMEIAKGGYKRVGGKDVMLADCRHRLCFNSLHSDPLIFKH